MSESPKADPAPPQPAEAGSGGGGGRRRTGRAADEPPRPGGRSSGGGGPVREGRSFLRSALAELRRVHWPHLAEVRAATIVVILCLVLVAGYVGLWEWLLEKVF